jgi:rRNA-processing protein FCF1
MRVFLDANILFSAAKSDGAIRWLLNRMLAEKVECCIDEFVLTEARRNLATKDQGALLELDGLAQRLRIFPLKAPPAQPRELRWLAAKDWPILAAAMRLKCDALLTGDKTHFGPGYGKAFGGVTIHSPKSLAQSLKLDA